MLKHEQSAQKIQAANIQYILLEQKLLSCVTCDTCVAYIFIYMDIYMHLYLSEGRNKVSKQPLHH